MEDRVREKENEEANGNTNVMHLSLRQTSLI